MTQTLRKRVTTAYELNTEHGTFPVNFEAETNYGKDALIKVSDDGLKAVVAYLTHDDDCPHPEDNDDYFGKIIGRGRYETRNHSEVEMFEALGLDRHGDPNYELVNDEVQARWVTFVEGITDGQWDALFKEWDLFLDDPDGYSNAVNQLRDNLVEVDINREGDMHYAFIEAERYCTELPNLTSEQVREAINAAKLEWDFEKVQDEEYNKALQAGRIGDPFAIVLDVYDHSGLHWSISGGGMQCRWDMSRGAGAWLPSDELRKEIQSRALTEAYAFVREAPVRLRGKDNKYQLVAVNWRDGKAELVSVQFSDAYTALWRKAKDLAAQMANDEPITAARQKWSELAVAERLCQNDLDQYNAWLMGDCWTCVTEFLSRESVNDDWENDDFDTCGGYIGSGEAYAVLESEHFTYAVNTHLK